MSNRYKRTFEFFDTKDEAKEFCNKINDSASDYVRKHHKANWTAWENEDRTEHKYIAWYSIK